MDFFFSASALHVWNDMRWNLFFWRANRPFIVKAAGLKFLLVALSGKNTTGLFSDLWKTRNDEYVRCLPHFKSHSDPSVKCSNADGFIMRTRGPESLFTTYVARVFNNAPLCDSSINFFF